MIKGIFDHSAFQRNQLQQWEKTALEKFETRMKDNKRPFPCIPATIGFNMNHLRYGFVGDPRTSSAIHDVVYLLSDYTKAAREYGKFTSLIIFYETPQDLRDTHTVEMYEQLFWQQLRRLCEHDEMEWPNHIPIDPHNPIWEFCYNGEPFFMYCATPSHQNRKSRYFDYFMLAITPRWVLQEFLKHENLAKRIKGQIRKRLENYDSIMIHPDLNSYGNPNNYEWRQYFLRDDETSLSQCPFHQILKKNIE